MRDRCIKVIDSCSSIEQLEGAMEYASLARPYLTEDDIDDIRYRSFWKMLYLTKTA
ncbi:MAG: hypothetical protein U5N56_00190 [Candidatus Marinimicrobia bacterium]|nr:hypothetical protein [Candidatus Neomarinimicrobiota bacterium]